MSAPTPFRFPKLAILKSAEELRQRFAGLGHPLPVDDTAQPAVLGRVIPAGIGIPKPIGNRWAILPMEGWDGTPDGRPTDLVRRRWRRFGQSGAKLIWGGEAVAVRPDGRANPHQLVLSEANTADLAALRAELLAGHLERHGSDQDLLVGLQLTHSGRFARPNDKTRLEPRIAYRHPLLDARFGITDDRAVLSDTEVDDLIADMVAATVRAQRAGFDFVDIKHCHGYLLHEFLSAHTRPGKFGGSFDNRTRILRDIIAGIRADGNGIDIGVRLSLFDMVPFRPDPALSQPGKLGPGIPEEHATLLPYHYAFGVNQAKPTEIDLTETFAFVQLLGELGVKILNTTAGSPYYNPHIQRPAAYPPSDGYQPAHDPLIDVARQVRVVREVRAQAPTGMIVVSSGLSYVQEYLPHLAQHILRTGGSDAIGVGRAVLSYPAMLADAAKNGAMETKFICRTFSDCTTAPRNGLISGCYPLDKYYTAKPEFQQLKDIKKSVGA